MQPKPHIIIVGGGLSGSLLAMAMRRHKSAFRVQLVEPGRIGGNHVWSFFQSDLNAEGQALVAPLVTRSWSEYGVMFPDGERNLAEPYFSITSERLADLVENMDIPIARQRAARLTGRTVELDDGTTLEADAVIDCRGFEGPPDGLECGWQKFVGRRFKVAHEFAHPIVMDAQLVEQVGGYRFMYVLPFGKDDLFLEDTYYSDDADLDVEALRVRIDEYIGVRELEGARVISEETGVLPVVIGGDFERFWPQDDRVARGGVRAGLFQYLTSYSLPDAVRFATWFAAEFRPGKNIARSTRDYASRHWKKGRFERMLGRMLFKAAEPDQRWRVLARFYRLPLPLIRRFYSGRLTWADKVRILAGKPPVPIGRAIKAIVA